MVKKLLLAYGWLPLCLIWVLPVTEPGFGQAPGTSLPAPGINVANFGAIADAQTSSTSSALCYNSSSTVLTCGASIFSPSDVGKSIEIPTAGGSATPPAPAPTFLATITAQTGTTATINPTAPVPVPMTSPVTVTWGTDNAAAFARAAAACPSPSNGTTALGVFTSKGCVFLVPNPGASGTGDYMFGSGVVLSTQTSFEIIGMGNSDKWEGSPQSGIRLVTAMPITILTIGQDGSSNYGGFRIENITFRDTSNNGSAIGGLLMKAASEAVIAYCSFENFNGQQLGATASPDPATTNLSYGMKTTAFAGSTALFTNHIVLLHDKGKNNSIWFDGGDGAQDGPIIVGGDVFPTNTVSGKPANPPYNNIAGCIGVVSGGPVRAYGTHFDVGTDATTPTHLPCIGVLTLVGGIISAKLESSPGGGDGMLLQASAAGQKALVVGDSQKFIGTGGAPYVRVSESIPNLVPGQSIVITHSSNPP